jgi:enoyl-CoA hydratase
MDGLTTMTYAVSGRIARITLDRPARGNGLTLQTPRELAACVEEANLDPTVHVIALSGNGKGFCGGYDLEASAEQGMAGQPSVGPSGSALDPAVQRDNHDPEGTWDPMVDYQMMSRNVRGFMSLFHSDKPVVCKVHGFCVAGGTDLALCSDLLVIEDTAKIGYPPARVWGVPTTALWVHRIGLEKAKRLMFTGDCLSGAEAVAWGLAIECAGPDRTDADQPARDDEADAQPDGPCAGARAQPAPGHRVRWHRAPYPRGLRVRAASSRGGVPAGRA